MQAKADSGHSHTTAPPQKTISDVAEVKRRLTAVSVLGGVRRVSSGVLATGLTVTGSQSSTVDRVEDCFVPRAAAMSSTRTWISSLRSGGDQRELEASYKALKPAAGM
jgi:hypothetical protein